jgi:hypothetical protein
MIESQRNNATTFPRRDVFVICQPDYTRMKTISIDSAKKYISLTRQFMEATKQL